VDGVPHSPTSLASAIRSHVRTLALFTLPFAAITPAIHLEIVPASPFSPFPSHAAALGFSLFMPGLLLATFALLLTYPRRRRFLVVHSGVLLLWVVGIALAGLLLHRDYLALPFPLVYSFFGVLVLRLDLLVGPSSRRELVERYSLVLLVATIGFMAWVIIMGYTIVARIEPRWQIAIVMNVCNALVIYELLAIYVQSRRRMYKMLRVDDEDVYLADQSLTSYFTSTERAIVKQFLESGGSAVNCRELVDVFHRDGVNPVRVDCRQCYEDNWAPSKCPAYVNLRKNYLAKIKRKLEMLHIGDIVPATEGSHAIKEAGWYLRLFDDVRIG
jgi:hypothetical protein